MSEPTANAKVSKPPIRWLGRSLAGCACLLVVTGAVAWWSGTMLLPLTLLVLAPSGALLQLVISWIGRERPQVMRMGTPVLWLLPALWIAWMGFDWQRPKNVFRMVAGFELPEGATNLRGRMVWGMDGWAFVRLEATDALKLELIAKADLVVADDYIPDPTAPPSEREARQQAFAKRANHQPEAYGFPAEQFKTPVAYRKRNPSTLSTEERARWIIDQDGSTVCIVL